MAGKIKYLNLDSLHRPTGKVLIAGNEYEVYPVSVRALINLAVLTAPSEEMTDDEAAGNIEKALDVICEIFPACPREVLNGLSMPQINALIEFCNDQGEEAVEKNSTAPTKTR